MLRYAGVALIRAYQRCLSPRKGYRCAYGVLHGTGTCSSIGLDIMQHQGVWAFWRKMPLQFDACRAAASTLNEEQKKKEEEKRKRRNGEISGSRRERDCRDWEDCELPCDSYDIALCEGAGGCMESNGCEFGACDSID